jgi:type IV pilus assembly protein PilC
MPKKAKEFARKTSAETFDLDKARGAEEAAAAEGLTLEIGRSKEKVKLKKKPGLGKTGNFFMDIYSRINEFVINLNKVKLQEKAVFFRLLAVMVDAGIPIIRSLQTLAEQTKKNPKFQRAIYDISRKIEAGESLSGGMEKHSDIFEESEIGMIRSGEVSGHLNDILRDLAHATEKNAKTLGKVKGALTYPIVVIVILFIVLFLMMVMVIPQISTLFSQTGADLPTITQFVINFSNFLRNNTLYILLGIVVFAGIFILWKRTKNGRYQWHSVVLHIPVVGGLVRKSTLAQFTRNLGNLLGAGVSIVQSMNIVANAMKNEVYMRKIKLAGDDLRGGIPLAETLRNTKYFPVMLVNMIEIGEQTAQLEDVCKRLSAFYDEQVDDSVKNLTKVIEPVIMIFVGAAVGGLVAAIMLPIMSLADIAGTV